MRFLSFLSLLFLTTLLPAQNECQISGLTATISDINPATCQYTVVLNFEHSGTTNQFKVQGNGTLYGTFTYNQLPVTLGPFTAGNAPSVREFVVRDAVFENCAAEFAIELPACAGATDCNIYDVVVTPGDCLPNSLNYNLSLDFEVTEPGNALFEVWTLSNQYLGIFPLSALPVQIENFPASGNAIDGIRICINDQPNCCRAKEFAAPDCTSGNDCEISQLLLDPGACTSNTTYHLTVNFDVVASGGVDSFQVFANGAFFAKYGLNQLPLNIPNFPYNGGANDVIKICVGNNLVECCRTQEFAVPDCLNGNNCAITQLVVDPGECHSNGTYQLYVNFGVEAPGTIDSFQVFANGAFFGKYGMNQLPLTIQNFPYNGGANDVIKICVGNDLAECCRVLEFPVPDCITGNTCEISQLLLDPGACTSNTTYQLYVNFDVAASGPIDSFLVFANGVLFGKYGLNQLPLNIPNFPYNGGANDVIKICVGNNLVECCRTQEFAVPDCLNETPCHIYDLQALHTACLCGQFFAVLTFEHENGGAGGFDIVGNGQNYGTFPYNHPQPIILGPFPGDGTIQEFVVRDHLHPDCRDAVEVAPVFCMVPVVDPNNANSLSIAPNPATEWLQVSAQMQGAAAGQSDLEVYAADGRLVIRRTVADGANFQLNVSELPAGMYRLVLSSEAGRMEGTFAKQ